jgi:hypothetical protein
VTRGSLGGQQHCADVDGQRLTDAGGGYVFERSHDAHAGAVNQDVQPPQVAHGGHHRSGYQRGLALEFGHDHLSID